MGQVGNYRESVGFYGLLMYACVNPPHATPFSAGLLTNFAGRILSRRAYRVGPVMHLIANIGWRVRKIRNGCLKHTLGLDKTREL
jgi:hypothetical protein